MNTLLCISAHPDDEALSFGALLMQAARLGWSIHLAWATVGEKSSSLDANRRWQEALQVADLLKATAHRFGLGDGHVSMGEFIPLADRLVRELKPTVVAWPCGTSPEQHQDHRVIHEGMLNIAGRSPYASSCWCIGQPPVEPDPAFCQPQFYFCYGESLLQDSISLMAAYQSEKQKRFASPHFLRSRAEQWAVRAGTAALFAEPFMLAKGIPPADLFLREIEIESRSLIANGQLTNDSNYHFDQSMSLLSNDSGDTVFGTPATSRPTNS